MQNARTQTKKLKVALFIAILLLASIVMSAMAATGIVFAANPWGYWDIHDLKENDRIDIGGHLWQVLKTDYKNDVYDHEGQGDEVSLTSPDTTKYELPVDGGVIQVALVDEIALEKEYDIPVGGTNFGDIDNAVVSGTDITGTERTDNSRTQMGSNYWTDSAIREYLNNDLLASFSSAEDAAVVSIPQAQLLWWGDADAEYPANPPEIVRYSDMSDEVDSANWFESFVRNDDLFVGIFPSFTPNGQDAYEHTNTGAENLFGTFPYRMLVVGQDGNGDEILNTDRSSLPVEGIDIESIPSSQMRVEYLGNALHAARYTINDRVFLPSIEQTIERNDFFGDGTRSTLLRTPDAAYGLGGSKVLYNDSGVLKSIYANESKEIVPMMFLDRNLKFGELRVDAEGVNVFGMMSNDKEHYNYNDVLVGDYIQFKGGDYRVVGKDIEDGILVRRDLATEETYALDAARPNAKIGQGSIPTTPEAIRRFPFNTLINDNDLEKESRAQKGSNFYYETDLRKTLNEEILQQELYSFEIDALNTVAKRTFLWWGDYKEEQIREDDSYGIIDSAKTRGVNYNGYDDFDNEIKKNLNRFAENGAWYDTGIKVEVDENTIYNYNNTTLYLDTNSQGPEQSLANLLSYNLTDKIYLPDLIDNANMRQDNKIKNKLGQPYDLAITSDDKNASSWTMQPYLGTSVERNERGWLGSIAYKSMYAPQDAEKDGISRLTHGAFANEEYAITPMVYIKVGTEFDSKGVVDYNDKEGNVVRPSNVDRDDDGNKRADWRRFEITTGESGKLENFDGFGNAKVGQTVSTQLNGAITSTNTPAGMTFAPSEGNTVITWTPTTSGPVTYTLNRSGDDAYSKPITENVDLGDIAYPSTISLNAVPGQTLGSIDKSGVQTTPAAVTWTWVEGDNFAIQESGNHNVVLSASNYNDTAEIVVYIAVNDESLDAMIPEAERTLNAEYNQALSALNSALQGIVAGKDNIGIIWATLADGNGDNPVGDVGKQEHNAYIFWEESPDKTQVIVITVVVSPAEAPEDVVPVIPADKKFDATYGDKMDSVLTQVNAESWINDLGTYTMDNASSTDVGDAGDQTHTIVFVSSNTNYKGKEVTITVAVAKADRTESEKTQAASTLKEAIAKTENAKSGGQLKDIALPEGFAWVNGDTVITAKAGESFSAEVTWTDNNHNASTFSVSFDVVDGGKESGAPIMLIVLAIVGGLIIIGVVVFFVMKKKGSGSSKF